MSKRITFDDAINQIAVAERLSDAETSALNKVYSQAPSAKLGSADWCTVKTSAVEVYFNDLDKWLEPNWPQLEFRFAKATPSSASDDVQAGNTHILTDVKYWATTDSLVEAFEKYGLTEEKIRNGSTKYIGNARKLPGQGGKGRAAQPMFCPYEIMQGLVHKARPNKLSEKRGWDILEKKFPATYSKFQEQDPRQYTD